MNIDNKKSLEKERDIMAALAERVFIVKENKTQEFLEKINKPMLSKEFLEQCKKASHNIRSKNK